jgi:cystathionine beta-lyase/cystathionine gamma-synthase
MDMERQSLSYILHHMDEDALPGNAVSPPIFQTSIFCFSSFREFRDAITDEVNHSLYTRGNNPTVMLAEEKLAALEGGERAKLVSSVSRQYLTLLWPSFRRETMLSVWKTPIPGRRYCSLRICPLWVTATFVDGRDTEEIQHAVRPETKLIYLESPTTFTFKLQDIGAVASFARSRELKL